MLKALISEISNDENNRTVVNDKVKHANKRFRFYNPLFGIEAIPKLFPIETVLIKKMRATKINSNKKSRREDSC